MKLSRAILSSFAVCLASAGTAFAQDDLTETNQLRTVLTGAQEVPEVATAGQGVLTLQFDEGLTQATFNLDVAGTNPVVAAHLHCGRAGENGPIVVTLFGPDPNGVPPAAPLAQGTITNASVVSPAGDPACGVPLNNIASVFAAIREGWIYTNVHSIVNPEGEVRGQVFMDARFRLGAPQPQPSPQPSPPGGTMGSPPTYR